MKKTSKKLTSLFLAILLCICALPLPALASYMPADENPQAEDALAEETGAIPEETASPTAEPAPAPKTTPTPAPETTPLPSEVIGSGGEAPSSFSEESESAESESPEEATPADTENEQPEAPASVEAEPKLEPESETSVPADPSPISSDGLVEEVPEPQQKQDAMLVGLDIQPISYAVVDEPLVKVTYHYTDVQVVTSATSPASSISAHSYCPLAKLENGHVAIPANMFPGKVTVRKDALKVTLDGELDVTVQAEYDAASGKLYLPARYWGHRIDVSWYCSYDEVTSISIAVDVGISRDGAFRKETYNLTLPSNADTIEIPLPEWENIVVSQCGIDLPNSAFTVEDGVLYVLASPLGGDIKIAAYAATAPRARLNSTRNTPARPSSVVHTRSADQIWYGYYTSYYTANGNVAFCVDPLLSGLDSGTYPISSWLDSSDSFLIKCAYYLYGGPGYDSIKYNIFGEPDAMWAYGMSHAVASYAYLGSLNGFEGLDSDLTNQLIQIGNYINSLPAPPDGFEVFLYNSGNRVTQALVGWQYTPGSDPDPDPPTPPPAATGNLLIRKVSADPGMTDGNPCYSLAGAVFDVYDVSGYLGATVTTDANGYADIDSIPVGSGYYFVERKPPQGFIATGQRYAFGVSANSTTTITVENVPQNDPTTIMLRKQDADTSSAAPQGGANLAGAQFTIKYYKGSYSSASALSSVTPARTWVVETDEDGFAMLHPDYKVSGDAFYYNSAGTIVTLPLGTVTIQETKAPEGYLINNEVFVRQITASGSMESVETYNEPIVKESIIRGGVSVEKWDAALNRKESQGDATLAGTVLEIINRTGKNVVVGGNTYGPGQVVHTLTTDEGGAAATANNLLPYGEYEIVEKTAPTGYLNTGTISQPFSITGNGVVVSLNKSDSVIKNNVIRGGLAINKWDLDLSRAEAQGDATLKGAVFDVYNRSAAGVIVGNTEYAPGEVVLSLTTDEGGYAATAEETLPYGSYEVVERSAPEGYLNTGVVRRSFTIRKHGVLVDLTVDGKSIENNVVRGGVKIAKWDAALNRKQAQGDATLQGAAVDIYNRSAGPVVVNGKEYAAGQVVMTLVTDENGLASTSETALPYGSYEIIEREDGAPEGYLHTGLLQRSFTIREQGVIIDLASDAGAIKNDVIRGGLKISKWDQELNRSQPQGGAVLENAVFDIYNRSKAVVLVEDTEYAPGEVVLSIATDKDGHAATAEDALPYGSYEVIERTPPEGYLASGVLKQTFTVREDEKIVELSSAESVIKNKVIRGGVEIHKWDSERNEAALKQGNATLAGAVFDIYNTSKYLVLVGGVEYAPGEIVLTLTTDKSGYASSAADALPYGSYEIVERTAPTGYLNSGVIRQGFRIREHGVNVSMTTGDTVIKNDIIRGNVLIEKWDNEIGEHRAQGGGTLEGATFEIVNRSLDSVLVQDVLYAPGEVVYTTVTDETGTAFTPEYLLPYGTYEVREIAPPFEGYLATGVLSRFFEIREHGKTVELNTAETAIRNDPLRGDLKGIKIADGTAQRLAGVPFSITSKTTGESHIVVTDVNGEFSTASEWNPHSQNTNAGQTGRDGVWFGELDALDDDKGALLYDDYIIEELPCEANEGFELLSFEVSVYRHNTVIDLGTLTDDYIPVPEIFTTALEKESMGNTAYAAESITIVDTVYYSGLKAGTEYTLKGVLMNKATGEPLMVGENQVTAEKTFRATAESGSTTMEFTFDASALKGKAVVVFESLYLEDKEIAVHADIEDTDQTITFLNPEIGTTATGPNGEKVLDATAETVIVDTVAYTGLQPGQEYTLKGQLMDKATGEAVQIDGQPVIAETVFTPEVAEGSVTVTFTLNAIALKGKSVVVFESLLHNGREIAIHADIEDEGQTVSFTEPKVGTTATGKDGEKELSLSAAATIVDKVAYENLSVGQEHTLKGTLMDKATGKPVLVGEKEVTAQTIFTPEQPNGTVEVTFTFDASALAGKQVVVFERLYIGDAEITAHTDIEDKDQTVSFIEPKIDTKAAGKDSKKDISLSAAAVIVDTVKYENLAVGQEYTLKGVLMDKSTGKPVLVGEKEITAETTFKPELPSGTVEVTFTFDASALAGKQVVVFERLYIGDAEITAHADIEDKDQTVSFTEPKIGTSASGKDGEKQLAISKTATIIDKVKYEGLTVGEKYTLKGVLMDKASGKPLLVDGKEIATKTEFTPEKADGSVEVTFTFDASALKGKEVVVFERLYIGENEIASHTDIEDKNQTVSFTEPKIGTSASGKDGEKQLAISRTATIIDKVKYEGLTVGEKYTLKGTLMDKSTGKALLVDGKEVAAENTFTPEKADGAVEVTFTFDASALKGKEVVVFERLYIGENEIASHTDIEDKNQTVSFTAYAMKLTKIDRATNKPLDGAEFTLYGEGGTEIKLSKDKDGAYFPDEKGSSSISTVDGVAIIKDLTDQRYTLREVTVPKGYVGYTELIPFKMEARDTEDDPFPVTVYNSPEGHKEGSGAKTGRSGLPVWALYSGIGLLVLAAGVGVLYLRKRKMN